MDIYKKMTYECKTIEDIRQQVYVNMLACGKQNSMFYHVFLTCLYSNRNGIKHEVYEKEDWGLNIKDINSLISFKNNHKIDKKLDIINYGYIYGDIGKKIVKYVCDFLDIRQMLDKYKVKVIFFDRDKPSTYVLRMLVRNGYYVIIPDGIKKTLTRKIVENQQYDIYTDSEGEIEYGRYCINENKKENISTYFSHDPFRMIDCVFQAIKMKLENCEDSTTFEYEYGKFPVALPHTCEVICVFPPNNTYSLVGLISRAVYSIKFKENYPYFRDQWLRQDKYGRECGYFKPIILPVLGPNIVKHYGYRKYCDDVDLYVDKGFIYHKSADRFMIVRNLIKDIKKNESNMSNVFLDIIKYYKQWVLLRMWSDHCGDIMVLINMILGIEPKYKDDYLEAQGIIKEQCRQIML